MRLDEAVLGANLLASPCLKPGSVHELILVKNCRNAAAGLNLGIARAGMTLWSACTKMFACRPDGTGGSSNNSMLPDCNADQSDSQGSTA